MSPSMIPNSFYLYLWRSSDSPGALYLAKDFETAETLCRGLTEDGYIVKVIRPGTNTEFELRAGKLCPTTDSSEGPPPKGGTNRMSPAFA